MSSKGWSLKKKKLHSQLYTIMGRCYTDTPYILHNVRNLFKIWLTYQENYQQYFLIFCCEETIFSTLPVWLFVCHKFLQNLGFLAYWPAIDLLVDGGIFSNVFKVYWKICQVLYFKDIEIHCMKGVAYKTWALWGVDTRIATTLNNEKQFQGWLY